MIQSQGTKYKSLASDIALKYSIWYTRIVSWACRNVYEGKYFRVYPKTSASHFYDSSSGLCSFSAFYLHTLFSAFLDALS